MDRLDAFERMLADIQRQAKEEAEQMERLESEGRKKSATYRQYTANRLLYKAMLSKYQEYGLV